MTQILTELTKRLKKKKKLVFMMMATMVVSSPLHAHPDGVGLHPIGTHLHGSMDSSMVVLTKDRRITNVLRSILA